jgi:hypothetical protein
MVEPVFDHKVKDIKISNIHFAFNNMELIKLLKNRGRAIANAKMDKKKEYEEKIDQLQK